MESIGQIFWSVPKQLQHMQNVIQINGPEPFEMHSLYLKKYNCDAYGS